MDSAIARELILLLREDESHNSTSLRKGELTLALETAIRNVKIKEERLDPNAKRHAKRMTRTLAEARKLKAAENSQKYSAGKDNSLLELED